MCLLWYIYEIYTFQYKMYSMYPYLCFKCLSTHRNSTHTLFLYVSFTFLCAHFTVTPCFFTMTMWFKTVKTNPSLRYNGLSPLVSQYDIQIHMHRQGFNTASLTRLEQPCLSQTIGVKRFVLYKETIRCTARQQDTATPPPNTPLLFDNMNSPLASQLSSNGIHKSSEHVSVSFEDELLFILHPLSSFKQET